MLVPLDLYVLYSERAASLGKDGHVAKVIKESEGKIN